MSQIVPAKRQRSMRPPRAPEPQEAPLGPVSGTSGPIKQPTCAPSGSKQPPLVTLTQTGRPPIRLRATPIALERIGSEERPSSLHSICCYGRPNGSYAFHISHPATMHASAARLRRSPCKTPPRSSMIAGTVESFDALATRLHQWSASGDPEAARSVNDDPRSAAPNPRRKGKRKAIKKGGPVQQGRPTSDAAVDQLIARFHCANGREQRARLVGRALHLVYQAAGD
ncbi:MAG: hypothetical protein AAF968_09470 [Pseudomonadota bacterium]